MDIDLSSHPLVARRAGQQGANSLAANGFANHSSGSRIDESKARLERQLAEEREPSPRFFCHLASHGITVNLVQLTNSRQAKAHQIEIDDDDDSNQENVDSSANNDMFKTLVATKAQSGSSKAKSLSASASAVSASASASASVPASSLASVRMSPIKHPQKRKRRAADDDYELDDPFIDDTELQVDENSMHSSDTKHISSHRFASHSGEVRLSPIKTKKEHHADAAHADATADADANAVDAQRQQAKRARLEATQLPTQIESLIAQLAIAWNKICQDRPLMPQPAADQDNANNHQSGQAAEAASAQSAADPAGADASNAAAAAPAAAKVNPQRIPAAIGVQLAEIDFALQESAASLTFIQHRNVISKTHARLAAILPFTGQQIRSRMKSEAKKIRREQRTQTINDCLARIKVAAQADLADFDRLRNMTPLVSQGCCRVISSEEAAVKAAAKAQTQNSAPPSPSQPLDQNGQPLTTAVPGQLSNASSGETAQYIVRWSLYLSDLLEATDANLALENITLKPGEPLTSEAHRCNKEFHSTIVKTCFQLHEKDMIDHKKLGSAYRAQKAKIYKSQQDKLDKQKAKEAAAAAAQQAAQEGQAKGQDASAQANPSDPTSASKQPHQADKAASASKSSSTKPRKDRTKSTSASASKSASASGTKKATQQAPIGANPSTDAAGAAQSATQPNDAASTWTKRKTSATQSAGQRNSSAKSKDATASAARAANQADPLRDAMSPARRPPLGAVFYPLPPLAERWTNTHFPMIQLPNAPNAPQGNNINDSLNDSSMQIDSTQ